MSASHEKRRLRGLILVAFALLAILAVAAFASYSLYSLRRSVEMTKEAQTMIPALPPFANQNFDVVVTPSIVALPASNRSVTVQLELTATNLTHDEPLVLETHTNIPGYSANFNPTSVTLHPGESVAIELTITIPSGVQNGTYPMSIVARGPSTQGGDWVVITIGPPETGPPP
jgi:uncharacterized membrane protein